LYHGADFRVKLFGLMEIDGLMGIGGAKIVHGMA
jgi:hypothetical protein